jgi:hypothetical protein
VVTGDEQTYLIFPCPPFPPFLEKLKKKHVEYWEISILLSSPICSNVVCLGYGNTLVLWGRSYEATLCA